LNNFIKKFIIRLFISPQSYYKTLETTAQTIFKEWFGKYQIGDELPEGWRLFQMNELVGTVNGYS
jgi:type I restriction enzyme S subunit